MKNEYQKFCRDIKDITRYYMLLVEETKSHKLVGSTNEWVLDNFYMISEQEKVLNVDLKSREFRQIGQERLAKIEDYVQEIFSDNHFQIEKAMLFDNLSKVQTKSGDFFTYPEVFALIPIAKYLLISNLAKLCRELEADNAYHYSPTDKSAADIEKLNEAAKRNLLMMSLFNSLRKVTKITMSSLIDAVSFSEQVLKKEKADMYNQMYDRTKDDYRAQIVRLAKKQRKKELDFVKEIVSSADAKNEHVGWQLFKPKRWNVRSHLYILIVTFATLLLATAFSFWATGGGWLTVISAVLTLVPASQIVIDLFSQVLYWFHKPVNTFKIKFKDGLIPKEYATMVIMPTILKNRNKTIELLEQLEIYYLSNLDRGSDGQKLNHRNQNIYYTLIGDAAAGPNADMPWDDEVVEAGLAKVKELNAKYGAPIFNFVYRRRAYSEGEGCWLGFERKRGAILHFNDLLLGNFSEEESKKWFRCETVSEWLQQAVTPITFVITLDTDTELVLYSAQKLIGAMAHPLNRARLSNDGRRVDAGYGIMQPRVNVDVEVTNKSKYAQLFSGLGGLDVYTTASFELYQDIFNEGSFCGKGIYDLKVFQHVLKGTFPQNLILSHDLIEGCHIRCGLINDVELFDDSPSNYIDDAKRHHRWTRGDWQIISWLGRKVRNERGDKVKNQVNTIGKWKIFDNLRRSVFSLACLIALFFGFAQAVGNPGSISPAWFVLAVILTVTCPILFFLVGQIRHLPRFNKRYRYYMTLMRGIGVVINRALVQFALLPKEAWMYTDAIIRSLYRMAFSHSNLLNWVPSDEAAKSTKGTLGDYIGKFWFNYICAAILAALTIFISRNNISPILIIASAFTCATWIFAPFMMYFLGKKFPQEKKELDEKETSEVKQWAKDTWNYFDRLLTAENNYLIPDNYQLNRAVKADTKTSPTNIGYSLTAVVSAAELGFITHDEAKKRISNIITTIAKLEKWNGHLFNWYRISDLQKLPNFFISTCDSGNFVACLYVVKSYLSHHDGDTKIIETVSLLIKNTDFSKLYNPSLDVFSIGFDYGSNCLLPYHYNNFASEARLTSFMTISQGDAPYKHWFCLDKTLVQYKGFKGVASWYGTLFEYFMPLIFLPTYRHTLMDETYSFAIRAQRSFIDNIKRRGTSHKIPWGISETAYHELDDAQNYKYHAFGVPYLKFQNTTPDRIVLSPYSSLMTIGINDRAVYENMERFKALEMYDEMGFFESYDEEDHVPVHAHYAHHQGMILASLTNYLAGNCIQQYFMEEPMMRSMETLLKEKAQIKPYIDLKVTLFKRYQYDKVQSESDAREFDHLEEVPEVGLLSNGEYTVFLNDRGAGYSCFHHIMLNRYRRISADHYGQFLFVRNLANDRLWCNTYAPLDVMPDRYRVSFASDKIQFLRVDGDIETKTEICVIKDRLAEIRRVTFTNSGDCDADLELTTYAEVVLSRHQDDESHRVFNGMGISSEYDDENHALFLSKTERNDHDTRNIVIHKLFILDEEQNSALPEYETSRLRFLGRGGSISHADVIDGHRTLTGTVGTTLDPIMSMRRRIHVPAGEQVTAVIITGFGKAREQLLRIINMYNNAINVNNAFETASVFNNMRNNMSLLKGAQMTLYNKIAKYILQTATLGNRRKQYLVKNKLSQSGLWRFGISGDNDIILMEINDINRSGFAKEILRAFEYWKTHGMILDIVFINDENGENREGLTHFIRNIADTEHLWTSHSNEGKVFVINGNELSDDERTLLHTVAAIAFNTVDGKMFEQLEMAEENNQHYQDMVDYPVMKPHSKHHVWSSLEFYNQYGGFDNNGRDYVVTNTNTPMPWVNVLSNPRFGCVISSTMAGFTFAYNSQQFKLTSWSNDIVRDNASEMLLINKQQFMPATARHGQGFSSFDAEYDSFKVMVRVFVSPEKMEKYYQIKIENKTNETLDLHIDMLYKLVLGTNEEQTARYLYGEWDSASNSLIVRNTYHEIYRDTRMQLTATESITDIEIDYPNRKRLGFDISVPANGEKEFAYIIAVLEKVDDKPIRRLLSETHDEFKAVEHFWDEKLSHIQVETPDKSLNIMLNRWYLYQVYTARLFARAGFYQVGGATGFRDQLQDCMSALYSDPAYARRQILEHAAHQFPEGDVLHWWHETLHLGARTTFSDDYLWLVYVTHQYVHVTGDASILEEQVAFCHGEPLNPGENERCLHYSTPQHKVAVTADEHDTGFEYATLYEHLRRSVNRSMSRIGVHGLPLMGCGDWNDGMSSVGVQGKGESVWVAFFLCDITPKMEELTQLMPAADLSYISELSDFRTRLVAALQKNTWDGAWFLRAFFDNGHAMGSRNNRECQIDLISQAWSILTDVATKEQKESVFRETDARLVNREHEIIQLLTPAFQHSEDKPGYIMLYPEGVRENGGQYTHGAMWYIMAQLKEGRTDMAYFLYSLINPTHRTSTLADVLKYKVEPYCIAADIYSNPQHPGRGGWTWYTGSASWAYKTGIENILGFQKHGDTLTLSPNIPSRWNSFSMTYKYGNSTYHIIYNRPKDAATQPTVINLVDDGKEHEIKIE
ncbi:MAG: DUF3131 domain-containing protein [Bacteroidales bacterium]|nr:DUF3131 domain-containing protein [Bacteroidales bacterium]